MAAGPLDRRITLQRNTPTTNSLNEEVASWADLATVWASRSDVSDGEKVAAFGLGSFQASRFKVRSDTTTRSLTPEDRISYDGSLWNIKGIKETTEGRFRFLEITAIRDAD